MFERVDESLDTKRVSAVQSYKFGISDKVTALVV